MLPSALGALGCSQQFATGNGFWSSFLLTLDKPCWSTPETRSPIPPVSPAWGQVLANRTKSPFFPASYHVMGKEAKDENESVRRECRRERKSPISETGGREGGMGSHGEQRTPSSAWAAWTTWPGPLGEWAAEQRPVRGQEGFLDEGENQPERT